MQGNNVGTDVNGGADVGNVLGGISVVGGDRNLIGGTADGEGNLVSGNTSSGVQLSPDGGDAAEDNDVQGNVIGTNAAGTASLPNNVGVTLITSPRQHDRRRRKRPPAT